MLTAGYKGLSKVVKIKSMLLLMKSHWPLNLTLINQLHISVYHDDLTVLNFLNCITVDLWQSVNVNVGCNCKCNGSELLIKLKKYLFGEKTKEKPANITTQ